MARKMKLLAFAGSTRTESFNKKLIRVAAKAAEAAGAEVTLIDLRDFPMPLYDGDLEASKGIPEKGLELKKLFEAHDGLLLSLPEYNSGYSAVFKNAIDWVSRKAAAEEPELSGFTGKYAALLSASPGALGGMRCLFQAREMLQNIGVTILPRMQSVGQAHNAFNDDGSLKDEKMAKGVAALVRSLITTLEKVRA